MKKKHICTDPDELRPDVIIEREEKPDGEIIYWLLQDQDMILLTFAQARNLIRSEYLP